MSDPATNPAHDLVDDPQESGHQPRIRVGTLLALLRVAAGRRGHASVVWNRFGFTYAITVVREVSSGTVAVDGDGEAIGLAQARQKIVEALSPPFPL